MNAIHREKLRRVLGLPDKIDPEYDGRFDNVNCPDRHGNTVVTTTVYVEPSAGYACKHRVFVVCPACGKRIPAGRWHQHAPVHKTWKVTTVHRDFPDDSREVLVVSDTEQEARDCMNLEVGEEIASCEVMGAALTLTKVTR